MQRFHKNKKLKELETKLETEENSKIRYKLLKKLSRLKESLKHDITFGSKELLKQITKAVNKKDTEKYNLLLKEYQENRILPIYLMGEMHHKGNRKFNFDLKNNLITFKPDKNTKIPIEFYCGKNQNKVLNKLQKLIEDNNISVSIRLVKDYIYLIFDEEKLHGYHLKKSEARKESKFKDRKFIFRKYYLEQEFRKLEGKISNRYMGVDLNPQFIGWSILEDNKIIDKGCFDLSKLSEKLNLSSTDPEQLNQNNKRKYEICQIWKAIFLIATHYQVSHFCIENLEFKKDPNFGKEFNRRTKNIWHRTLTLQLIKKYCRIFGIELIEVNPVYSSFIGNIKYKYFDPINASLEICRRGMNKFKKSEFYPELSRSDLDTMVALVSDQSRDAPDKTIDNFLKISNNWKSCFDFFKHTKLKYRGVLKDFKTFSFNSHKSNVFQYSY